MAGRVFGYVLVSTALQASEGDSLDVQQRQVAGYAMQHGWTIETTFREEGVSGSVPLLGRPQGAALLAAVRAGDVVVAAKLDRVFRSALDALQMVEELQRRRVSLHLLDLGGDVSGNGMSRLFLTVAAAFAEAERARIRERVTVVKRDQKARGRFLGGVAPFGFQAGNDGNLIAVDAEQEALGTMRQLRSAGLSYRAIAAAVAERHPTVRAVSHVTVRRVLEEETEEAGSPVQNGGKAV